MDGSHSKTFLGNNTSIDPDFANYGFQASHLIRSSFFPFYKREIIVESLQPPFVVVVVVDL